VLKFVKFPPFRNSAGANGQGLQPPPLPPKKRDIINYMEMLGQSLLPSSKGSITRCVFDVRFHVRQTVCPPMSHASASNGLSDIETQIENAPCNRPQSEGDIHVPQSAAYEAIYTCPIMRMNRCTILCKICIQRVKDFNYPSDTNYNCLSTQII
jgi:hypothetical protein